MTISNPQASLLNLHDYEQYLTPHKGKKGFYHCPSCDSKLSINKSNGEKFTCYGCGDYSAIRKSILKLSGGDANISSREMERRQARQQKKTEQERVRVAKLQTETERNGNWLKIVSGSTLSDRHRQEMKDRGWSDEWIDRCQARSSSQGRVIPIVTANGMMVGSQVALNDGGKTWYGSAGTHHLQETHELPLLIVYPKYPNQRIDLESGLAIGTIAYTESTLDKPWLCAQLRNCVTIGSSNISSQPKDLERSIAIIKAKYGWDAIEHVLMADGGSHSNQGVMKNYANLEQQIESIGEGTLLVGWWGQVDKVVGDIDEISPEIAIEKIPFAEFVRKGSLPVEVPAFLVEIARVDKAEADEIAAKQLIAATDTIEYQGLTKLTHAPSQIRNERFLSFVYTKPGIIAAIVSACGTGKTEILKELIRHWKENYGGVDGRIIDLVHLNSIKDSHQIRLAIQEWRFSNKDDGARLKYNNAISICLDSILRIELEDITPASLLIMDEFEAQLAHIAKGGTFGGKLAKAQAHLAAIMERILATGGSIVILEDDLTDISIDGILDLTNRKYPLELIRNDFLSFLWKMNIGSKNYEAFISSVLGRIANGENIFMPVTSQRDGEAIHRLILEYFPHLKDFIVRIDSDTTVDCKEILANPNEYLKTHNVRVLIGSPSIQSGFNSSSNHFDRVCAIFKNMDTRAHVQMIHRDRSNAPRDIFIKTRGAEAGGKMKSVAKLERMVKNTAQKTLLANGEGKIPANRIGDVWNHLAAQFEVRSTLSSNYNKDYFIAEMIDRGHEVVTEAWGADDRFTGCKDRLSVIKDEIEQEYNRKFWEKDGNSISIGRALQLKHMSGITPELKMLGKKCELEHDLPGVEKSEEFCLLAVTKNSAKLMKQCVLTFFVKHPILAELQDKAILNGMKEQPHLVLGRVPKMVQKVSLLSQIVKYAEILIAKGKYDSNDEDAIALHNYLVKNSYLFLALGFRTVFNQTFTDAKGKEYNSPVSNANKAFKLLGYATAEVERTGGRSDTRYVYKIANADCPHRATVEQGLINKYGSVMGTSVDGGDIGSNVDTITPIPYTHPKHQINDRVFCSNTKKVGTIWAIDDKNRAAFVEEGTSLAEWIAIDSLEAA